MAARRHLTAALLLALAGCGGDAGTGEEVRLLAPAGIADDFARFERETRCRVDLRVYDEEEDVEAIARRRDVDVIAGPIPAGATPHVSEELVRVTIAEGLEVTIPKRLATAFEAPARPAGRRSLAWSIREEGENGACARRWLAYVTSQ
jgi:fructose-1-phosphate kinase PfkB-like protein